MGAAETTAIAIAIDETVTFGRYAAVSAAIHAV
jgi:hypothetical protein